MWGIKDKVIAKHWALIGIISSLIGSLMFYAQHNIKGFLVGWVILGLNFYNYQCLDKNGD